MRAVRFANFVLTTAGIVFLLMAVYVIYRNRGLLSDIPAFAYLIPAVCAVLAFASLTLQPMARVNVALTLISVALALYAAESFLLLSAPTTPIQRTAKRLGMPYDGRTRLQIVGDMRSEGVNAYPTAVPALFFRSSAYNGQVVPLGGVANAATVLCNELGPYAIYNSDEHGFNNPKGIWKSDKLQVAAVGDSFTHGACVPAGTDLMSLIRKRWPRALGFGYNANGPLLELAAVREFLPALKPDVVLWNYFEGNDLGELTVEKSNPILMSYLSGGFKQGLTDRQAEVDSLLVSWVNASMNGADASGLAAVLNEGVSTVDKVRGFITLRSLRRRLGGLTVTPALSGEQSGNCELPLFRKVLQQAKSTVSSWGGTMYFVYLPSWTRYYGNMHRCEQARDQVLALVRSLEIPVIDMHAVFEAHGKPARFFAQGDYNFAHYGVDGYSLVAQTVIDSISAAGLGGSAVPERSAAAAAP